MEIQNVVIEITRKCQLKCAHCLRGNAQGVNIKTEYLESFFSRVKAIDTLTISGGEPSLVPEKILEIIAIAKKHKTEIGSFYIATNAAKNPKFKSFILACMELYMYCSDNEISSINWSNDKYHQNEPENIRLLSILKFASEKFSKEFGLPSIIAEGRAKDFGERKVLIDSFEIDDNYQVISEGAIYLNCKGEIIAGCDWSYRSQTKYKICDVSDLSFDRIKDYQEKKQKE